jgi:hypothetical protein
VPRRELVVDRVDPLGTDVRGDERWSSCVATARSTLPVAALVG